VATASAPSPVHVRLLGAQRVVAQPQRVAQPVEQPGRRGGFDDKDRAPESLDRRGAARRNRVCARSSAGGVGIRIHAEELSPD
jgi:hypothetical protein